MVLWWEAPLGEPLRFVENHDVMARPYDLAEAVCCGEVATLWQGRDVVVRPFRFERNCHGVEKYKASFLP